MRTGLDLAAGQLVRKGGRFQAEVMLTGLSQCLWSLSNSYWPCGAL